MTIGLPFSGKSSLARKYEAEGYEIIERDKILPELLRSNEFREKLSSLLKTKEGISDQELFDVKNRLLAEMLSEKVRNLILTSRADNFFYDGTNLQRISRAGILKLKDDGVEVNAMYLKVPLEEIVDRAKKVYVNGERKGSFNEQALPALVKMINMFEEPELTEGFTDLKIINVSQETDQEFKSFK